MALAKDKGFAVSTPEGITFVEPGTEARYAHYHDDPVGFFRQVLKVEPWSKQVEILEAVRDHDRVSVRSSHGIGKTFTASGIALWFLLTRPNSVVLSTSPTWRQVKELLWREVRGHHVRAKLPGKCNTTDLQLGAQWYALGLSTNEPDRFAGFHAADLLLICDEAAGIDAAIYDVAEGVLTSAGSKQLLIGNPTSTSGRFYDTHHRARGAWRTIHVSTDDTPAFTGEAVSPQVLAKLPSPQWRERCRLEWGEESPMFAVRVRGEFPDQAEDSLVALSDIEAAALLEPEAIGQIEMGVDIARHGACETVVYVRQGARVLAMDAWRKPDLMQTAGRIQALARQHNAAIIRIDATGMGVGVVDRLREQNVPVQAIWVGERAEDPERFTLRRDEIWWGLRERLRAREIGPLTDTITQAQISAVKYRYDSRSRILVESKDEMQKRGLPSPDRADALCLAFLGTPEAASEILEPDDSYYVPDRNINPWGDEGWRP